MTLITPPKWRPSCSLSVSPSPPGSDLTVVVTGEADCVTADQLRDQLVECCGPEVERLTLELGGLGFCNLRGLGALHEAVEFTRRAGIDVTMRGMSRQLTWLHSSFAERLAPRRGLDLASPDLRRGSLAVEAATASEQPWETADTA